MSHELAKLVVAGAALYLGIGAVFSLPFAFRWAGRLDPAARSGSVGFRLLILPGAALLWPLLLLRLRRAS